MHYGELGLEKSAIIFDAINTAWFELCTGK
jgi:hypothetical protein